MCQQHLNIKTNLHTSGQVSTAMLLQIDDFISGKQTTKVIVFSTEFTSRQERFRYAATTSKKSIPLFFF